MKTAEELLKEKGITPETVHHNYNYVYRVVCDLIGEAQKEAYNQAFEDEATEEMKANARLIAATPDLLKALQMCWASLKTYGDHQIIDMYCEKAINKALGR